MISAGATMDSEAHGAGGTPLIAALFWGAPHPIAAPALPLPGLRCANPREKRRHREREDEPDDTP